MKRSFMTALVAALCFFATWTVAADPAEAPIPEPTAAESTPTEAELTAVDSNVAKTESTVNAEQASEDSAAELPSANLETLNPESGLRQNNSCTYTCSHPLMCPNIIDLPRASCVSGCCVW